MTATGTAMTAAGAALAALALVGLLGTVVARRGSGVLSRQRTRSLTPGRSAEPPSGKHPVRHIAATIERRRSNHVLREIDASHVAALLDRTARHCASGQSLGLAFAESLAGSPIRPLFEPAVRAIETGASIDDAFSMQVSDHPHLVLATHALRLCARQGGNVTESLDRAAATLRDRSTAAHERHAQSAQARMSARVLTILPVAFGGWTIATTPSVRHFVATPAGLGCLGAGLVLNACGWYAMSRVVGRAG